MREDDTIQVTDSISTIESNQRNIKDKRYHNSKNQIYLGCITCDLYTWFNQEDIHNPICPYCQKVL